MLNAFHGRINRKTFIFGNLIGLGALGFVAFILLVPPAFIDIILNNSVSHLIYKTFFYFLLLPGLVYFFYFSVLFVKRVHDIGYPGMVWLGSFVLSEILAKLTDISMFNLIGALIIAAICVLPGQKIRNEFGGKPHKVFKLTNVIPKV